MCPACISTAALVATGATSASGVTAFIIKLLRPKGGAKTKLEQPGPKENS